MSNPIADGALFYLTQQHRHGSESQPNLASNSPFPSSADDNQSYPRSSSQRDSGLLGEARERWKSVLSRLSLTADTTATRSTDPDHCTSDIEESSTYELLQKDSDHRRGSWHYPPRIWQQFKSHHHHHHHHHSRQQDPSKDDDQLPSTQDLFESAGRNQQRQSAGEDNYFLHPFRRQWRHRRRQEGDDDATDDEEDEEQDQLATKPVIPTPRTRLTRVSIDGGGQGDTMDQDTMARDNWGKTFDKIKMIANIQNFPGLGTARDDNIDTQNTNGRDMHMVPTTSTALAPYYPPTFEPVFIALSRDEYGRKLPPIIPAMISVTVTDSEYLKNLNQWVFRTQLQYGDIKWVIKRTIADFTTLHYTLKFKSSLSDYVPNPPQFPDQLGSLISSARTTIGLDREGESDYDGQPEGEKKEMALARRLALTQYLRNLLSKSHMLMSYDICEFFEISSISIVQDMGWKGKEGFLEHRLRESSPTFCGVWKVHRWHKEWVLLRDSYIAFCDGIASPSPSDIMLFDKTFTIKVSEPSLLGSYHMTLGTEYRQIEFKGSRREVEEWLESIEKVKTNSPWVKNHRFNSFAPIRHHARVKWFVDGENHFNAVAEAILSAKSEIYIADWWLTPELYLRRPPEKNEEFRIDRVLQRKAEEGVKIYIIVYKEMSLALTIDSAHTKQWLQNLHPNIIVQRHPDRRPFDSRDSVFFWSHHEKLVVVDNRLALIGGLDLCFGRYDTHAHRHADFPAKGHKFCIFPGQDYSSPRVKDFVDVAAKHDTTLVDREETPRMPWHDMSCAVVGPIARDAARLFIQRWNFLKATKSMHRPVVPYLMPKGEYVAQRDESKFEGTCRVQLLRSVSNWSSGIGREHSIYNAYMEAISQAKHFVYIENQFFISATGEDKIVRNKIGQALVDRIKRAHFNQEKFKVFIIIPLIPAFEGDLLSGDSVAARGVMHFQYISMNRGGASICEKLREEGIDPSEYIGWYSLRNWDKIAPRFPKKKKGKKSSTPTSNGNTNNGNTLSVSMEDKEDLASLSSSSSPKMDDCSEENEDVDDRDHYVSELVYIHDKLMIIDDRIVLLGSANINDRSLLGNRDSEMAIFIEDTEMISSYMDGQPYQAAKFAHTLRMQLWKEHLGLLDFKDWESLMDESVDNILQARASEDIGYNTSASGGTGWWDDAVGNNDRDIQTYEHDEAVRLIDRMSRTRSVYDKFAHGPRDNYIKEAAALDPLADRCYYNIWRRTAESNTLIYRDLFRCVPDDTIHTFDQHRKFVSDKVPYGHIADPDRPASEISERLSGVRGHLVNFPTDYLKDETLMNVFESMAPMTLFS